ncbi:Imm21 family immunity protein [Streptomyces hirsutus]|uniref:Imm21 family immunity protein n=1 Tax=Streptomyces hirsutus TaxID=35620 RepID=UPI00363B066F
MRPLNCDVGRGITAESGRRPQMAYVQCPYVGACCQSQRQSRAQWVTVTGLRPAKMRPEKRTIKGCTGAGLGAPAKTVPDGNGRWWSRTPGSPPERCDPWAGQVLATAQESLPRARPRWLHGAGARRPAIVGRSTAPDDCDRICEVNGLAGVIAIGGSGAQVLVVTDEPATNCYLSEYRTHPCLWTPSRWVPKGASSVPVAGCPLRCRSCPATGGAPAAVRLRPTGAPVSRSTHLYEASSRDRF